jgi:hypothetical protein
MNDKALDQSNLIVKNWREFQHYKDRAPPWIKLQKTLLDDYDFQCLPIASKALAPMLWLLASESMDGSIPSSPDRIAFRLRWPIADVVSGINPLIEKGFLIGASIVLADCKQHATPEAEAYREEGYRKEAKSSLRSGTARDAPAKPVSSEEYARRRMVALGVPEDLLEDFLRVRKSHRAPFTDNAAIGIIREAEIAGLTETEAIRMCVERNWRGFRADFIKKPFEAQNARH